MFPLLERSCDGVVLVSETATRDAMALLLRRHKMLVEPSGALAVAAALATPKAERGESVCILSGGSVADELLRDLVAST